MHSLPTSCIAGMYIVSLLHLGHHTSAVGAASQMIFRELAPCCSPAGKEMTKEGTGSRATAGRFCHLSTIAVAEKIYVVF
mmetsp:Transcript_16350/g.48729  ORF Transcript_16350/g.48729 Transcript_16350/m.48729 type:complete len:80 (-) Transcript_16350:3258-3497(-)